MFIVYTIAKCPFCQDTLKLLKKHNLFAEVIEVNKEDKEMIKKQHGMNTFPQIFYKFITQGKKRKYTYIRLIGGYSDLKDLLDDLDSSDTKKKYSKLLLSRLQNEVLKS